MVLKFTFFLVPRATQVLTKFCSFLGLILVIGVGKSTSFFVQPDKLKGSGCFFGGIIVVLLGWPIIGMAIEIYGFITLFGGFFPMAINVLRVMPVIGTILALPGISNVCDTIVGQGQWLYDWRVLPNMYSFFLFFLGFYIKLESYFMENINKLIFKK